MSNIVPFHFGSHEVRIYVDDAGEPWWVAKDVCDVLGLAKVDRTLARLRPEEKGAHPMRTPGGPQLMSTVTESGLYRLIFRSDKLEAEEFQRWVFHEVLPTLRKTGQYIMPTPEPPPLPEPKAQLTLIDQAHALLAKLGQLTERDTLMLADQARNVMQVGQRLLPAPASGATTRVENTPAAVYGFSVAERVAQLGYRLSRKQQAALYPQIGKRLAEEWRSRYEGEPVKETRWVDGAQRPVAWYAQEEASWVDPIIQSYLSQFPGIISTDT